MTFQFDFSEIAAAATAAKSAIQRIGASQPADPQEAISELAALAAHEQSQSQASEPSTADRLFEARRKRGLALGFADAEGLAERLALRDADADDRRLCIECRHCRRNGCAKGDAWLPRILQRCDRFAAAELVTPEAA